MKKPVIGITPRLNDEQTQLSLNLTYLFPFNERHCGVIILPLNSPALEDVLMLCDGFVISGGNDIDPTYYQESNEGLSKKINESLDTLDKLTIEHAVKYHKPLLGICRGAQAIAAFLGGSLHQDLAACQVSHTEDEQHLHEVVKVTNTSFTKLLPAKFITNSFHHQAVNRLPQDFVTIYKQNDTIEGIEHTTLPIIGLQWHPERMNTPQTNIIFDHFMELVTTYVKK